MAIAGVLAMQPQCVVLDEPTAMLDPQGRREVLDTIERLNREKGITVILITHHMDEAVRAGRVIAMSEGKIIADGTPSAVCASVVSWSVSSFLKTYYALDTIHQSSPKRRTCRSADY